MTVPKYALGWDVFQAARFPNSWDNEGYPLYNFRWGLYVNQMASSASAGSLAAEMHSSADSLVTEPYWNTGNLVTETYWAPAKHYNNGNYREREVVLGELGASYIQLTIETPCRERHLACQAGLCNIDLARGTGFAARTTPMG